MRPFLSFFTPTHRPRLLAQCMASMQAQTAVVAVEHVIVPDYVGRGIVASLYGGVARYAAILSGEYVHILADDDVLADQDVVEHLRACAREHQQPEVIVVQVQKGRRVFPVNPGSPPALGQIDMASYVLRQDVFQRHAADYGAHYAGDVDHALKLWRAGYRHVFHDRLFLRGGTTSGKGDAHHRQAEAPTCLPY